MLKLNDKAVLKSWLLEIHSSCFVPVLVPHCYEVSMVMTGNGICPLGVYLFVKLASLLENIITYSRY